MGYVIKHVPGGVKTKIITIFVYVYILCVT